MKQNVNQESDRKSIKRKLADAFGAAAGEEARQAEVRVNRIQAHPAVQCSQMGAKLAKLLAQQCQCQRLQFLAVLCQKSVDLIASGSGWQFVRAFCR
jgi:hypothetical protein